LRAITRQHDSLLIFDEVISGFRVSLGGAQEYYQIQPDLTTLGKIIGGGLPIGAYGGRRDIMSLISPRGPVYQAGTLAGNPVAVSAGLATLQIIHTEDVIGQVNAKAARFYQELQPILKAATAICPNAIASMHTLFFQAGPVRDYQDALRSDTRQFARFFNGLLEQGVYIAPSQFEASFVSLAHSDDDLAHACDAIHAALAQL